MLHTCGFVAFIIYLTFSYYLFFDVSIKLTMQLFLLPETSQLWRQSPSTCTENQTRKRKIKTKVCF